MLYKKGFLALIISTVAIMQLGAMSVEQNNDAKEKKSTYRFELNERAEEKTEKNKDSLGSIIEKYAMNYIPAEGSELLKKFGTVSKGKQEAPSSSDLKRKKNNIHRIIEKPLKNAHVRRCLDFGFSDDQQNNLLQKSSPKLNPNCSVILKWNNTCLPQAFVLDTLAQLNRLLQPNIDQQSNKFNEDNYNAFVSLINFLYREKTEVDTYNGKYSEILKNAALLTKYGKVSKEVSAVVLSKYALRNGNLIICRNPIKE